MQTTNTDKKYSDNTGNIIIKDFFSIGKHFYLSKMSKFRQFFVKNNKYFFVAMLFSIALSIGTIATTSALLNGKTIINSNSIIALICLPFSLFLTVILIAAVYCGTKRSQDISHIDNFINGKTDEDTLISTEITKEEKELVIETTKNADKKMCEGLSEGKLDCLTLQKDFTDTVTPVFTKVFTGVISRRLNKYYDIIINDNVFIEDFLSVLFDSFKEAKKKQGKNFPTNLNESDIKLCVEHIITQNAYKSFYKAAIKIDNKPVPIYLDREIEGIKLSIPKMIENINTEKLYNAIVNSDKFALKVAEIMKIISDPQTSLETDIETPKSSSVEAEKVEYESTSVTTAIEEVLVARKVLDALGNAIAAERC